MSDLRIRLTADGTVAEIDLIDTIGPINTWRSRTPGAFGVESAAFVNSGGTLSARGCGALPCWRLFDFDIDLNKTGDTGRGENSDAQGNFPVGDLTWLVL